MKAKKLKKKKIKIPAWLSKPKRKAKKKKASRKKVKRIKAKKPKAKKKKGLIPIHVKMSASQLAAMKLKAKKHAKGNVSLWMRYTGLRYTPKRGEIIKA